MIPQIVVPVFFAMGALKPVLSRKALLHESESETEQKCEQRRNLKTDAESEQGSSGGSAHAAGEMPELSIRACDGWQCVQCIRWRVWRLVGADSLPPLCLLTGCSCRSRMPDWRVRRWESALPGLLGRVRPVLRRGTTSRRGEEREERGRRKVRERQKNAKLVSEPATRQTKSQLLHETNHFCQQMQSAERVQSRADAEAGEDSGHSSPLPRSPAASGRSAESMSECS